MSFAWRFHMKKKLLNSLGMALKAYFTFILDIYEI